MDFLVAPPYLDETAGTLRPDAVIPIDWDNFFCLCALLSFCLA